MNSEYYRVFRAFADAKRVRILELLCENEECACVLLDDLDISQPTLSHHMKILCDSGLVTGRKQGRWMYYRINKDGCEYASQLLNNLKEQKMDDLLKIATEMHRALRFLGSSHRVHAKAQRGDLSLKCCCASHEKQ